MCQHDNQNWRPWTLRAQQPTVELTLALAQKLTRPVLQQAVEGLPAKLARICGYHSGWWDGDGDTGRSAPTGKALRPALALLAAQATSDDPTPAVPVAAPVELVHNFILIHDDVMDDDELRRGRATAWKVFGVGPVVLAADALLSEAFRLVQQQGPRNSTGPLERAVSALVAGQAADLAFEQRDPASITVAEYLAMAAGWSGSTCSRTSRQHLGIAAACPPRCAGGVPGRQRRRH